MASVGPIDEAAGKISEIQHLLGEQRLQEAKRLRTVIGPSTRRHTPVGARKARGGLEVDLLKRRKLGRIVELVRNAERVTD